jgi:hypothetical protein
MSDRQPELPAQEPIHGGWFGGTGCPECGCDENCGAVIERTRIVGYLRESAKLLRRVAYGDDKHARSRKGGVSALMGTAQAIEQGRHAK